MLTSLLRVLELAVMAGSWTFAGYALLPRAIRRGEPFRVWASALALGAGISAAVLTALAAAHALNRAAVVVVAAAALALAIAGVVQARHDGTLRRPALPSGWLERLALLALAAISLATLVGALAPPSSMDAVVYHLRVPREFLRSGSLLALEDVHSYQPLYIQMLFGQGLVFGGGALAALVHWALGVGAIAGAAAWGKRLGGSALWSAVVFGATGLYVWESPSAFIDLGLALFSSLGLLWAIDREHGKAAVVLGGVFAGLAAGSKFTGVIAAALIGLAAMAAMWPDWRRGLARAAAVGALALAVALPWYARNALLTGNPIYPLAHHLFTGQTLDHAQQLSSMPYGLGSDLLHLLSSPFDLLARGELFDQGWSVGPAFLGFCPIGLWVARRARAAWIVVAVVAVWWLIWFYSSPQTRLLVPILPPAAGLAGAGLRAALNAGSKLPRLAACAVAGVAIAGGLGSAALCVAMTAKVVAGAETPEAFLRRQSWHYVAYEEANRILPGDAKVAVDAVNNLFYLERDARFFVTEHPSAAALRQQGFSHRLSVLDCPREAPEPGVKVIWEGSYPLRLSRLRGGVRSTVCARIESLLPPGDQLAK